jgi:hypothetical protein
MEEAKARLHGDLLIRSCGGAVAEGHRAAGEGCVAVGCGRQGGFRLLHVVLHAVLYSQPPTKAPDPVPSGC